MRIARSSLIAALDHSLFSVSILVLCVVWLREHFSVLSCCIIPVRLNIFLSLIQTPDIVIRSMWYSATTLNTIQRWSRKDCYASSEIIYLNAPPIQRLRFKFVKSFACSISFWFLVAIYSSIPLLYPLILSLDFSFFSFQGARSLEEYQKMNQDQRQYPWQASQWSMPSFSETAYWAGGPVWGIDPYGNIFAIGWLV